MFASITFCEETSDSESSRKRNENIDCTFEPGEATADIDNNDSTLRKKRRKKHKTSVVEHDSSIQQANDIDGCNHGHKQKHKKFKRDQTEQKFDGEDIHATCNASDNDHLNSNIIEAENSRASCQRGSKHEVVLTSGTKVSDVRYCDVAKLLSVGDEVHKSNGVNSKNAMSERQSCTESGFDTCRKMSAGSEVLVEQTPELNEGCQRRTEPSEPMALSDSLCAISSPFATGNSRNNSIHYFKSGDEGSLCPSEGLNVVSESNFEANGTSRASFKSPNDLVGVQVLSNATDSSLLADNGSKSAGRKKRRTRRRKSKRNGSSLADSVVSKNSSPSPMREVNANGDMSGKLGMRHQDSPWPEPASRGHIFFKDDSSSSDSESDVISDKNGSVAYEKAETSANISKQSVSLNHSILPSMPQANSRSCSDVESSLVARRPSERTVIHSASSSALSPSAESSVFRPPINSGTTVVSKLLGCERENGSRSKMNSPFAGVQVFCRQRFKKMPTVGWNENRLPVISAETKHVSDASCTITRSCSRQAHVSADGCKEVT